MVGDARFLHFRAGRFTTGGPVCLPGKLISRFSCPAQQLRWFRVCGYDEAMSDPHPLSILDDQPLILVGNGACDLDQLAAAPAGHLVAVDGGLRHCQAAGLNPEAVIGDMDSADLAGLSATYPDMPVYHLDDQNNTDFEKALMMFSAQVCLAYGFLGLRFDHMLASLSVMARYSDQHQVILVGENDVVHVTRKAFSMSVSAGARLSVWPVGQVSFSTSSGLVWPLDGLTLSPDGQVATSNRMQTDNLTLTPADGNQGAYAVCCDPEFLPEMLAALTGGSHWR